MIKNRLQSVLVFTLTLVAGCGEQHSFISSGEYLGSTLASAEEIQSVVLDKHNGFLKERKIGQYIYKTLYKPVDFIISREKTETIDRQSYLEKKNSLDGLYYFDLRIVNTTNTGDLLKSISSDYGDYDLKVKYCAYQMQYDIHLVAGTDTIPCILFHFERTFDVAPVSTFLLGFAKPVSHQYDDLQLIYHDNLFNNGIIKFHFTREDIENVPNLEL